MLPVGLTSDVGAIAEHHEEGLRLRAAGAFTDTEWGEHQAITMAALILLSVDGMQRLCRQALTAEFCSALG